MHQRGAGDGLTTRLRLRTAIAIGITVAAGALVVLAGLRMEPLLWGAVGIMSALGIATSLFSFQLDEKTSVTLGPAVFIGTVALFGAPVAVWVAAISTLLMEFMRFRRGGMPAVARVGVRVIAIVAAAAAYWAASGRVPNGVLTLPDIARFLLMFAVFSTVCGLLDASFEEPNGHGVKRYVRLLWGKGVVVELAMIPLALLLVACYTPSEPATFPLLAVVLMISGAAGQKLWETQQALWERVGELKTLNTVGDVLTSSLRMDDLVRLIHEQTCGLLGAPVLAIALYDEEKNELEFRARVAEDCELSSWRTEIDTSCSGWVAANREVLYVRDVRADEGRDVTPCLAEHAEAAGVEVRSWLGVPLMSAEHLTGVLSIGSDAPDAFDAATRELLETIGTQVGRVAENARLYSELERARTSAENWNKELEHRVKERTEEVNDAKEALEALNQDLEDRVEARTQELKDMQTKIVQSGRLAAVGELAAGVAHELNNPLAGILGYAQFDLERLADVEKNSIEEQDVDRFRTHLTFIERETQRCREIVENLLRFAETSRCASTEVDVNALIKETLGFTSRELSTRGIELKAELGDAELPVVGDPRQLQQVFANIILNARKAMSSGGRLSVRSAVVDGPSEGTKCVAVSFGDTGCGISDDNLVRVLEPFFTTSDVGEGTGLGLSVSYGIVKDHNGEIDVQSKVGVGSTFTVLLPIAPDGAGGSMAEGQA